ncbi:unnamed protein product [Linum tenue]|uniref:Uncharacterized protein n=1 Tax=Linum tenue TaxID=586396 RepID=A0AAV0NIL7_9ROSI|nr:unnamed protein product [Linum tenue]CAI0458126.1 unnamed protein product [Linum tenue]
MNMKEEGSQMDKAEVAVAKKVKGRGSTKHPNAYCILCSLSRGISIS